MKIEVFTLYMEYEYKRGDVTIHTKNTRTGISRVAVKTYLDYYFNNSKYSHVTYDVRSEGIQKW